MSEHPHSTVWLAEHKVLGVKRIIKGIPKNAAEFDFLAREAHLMKNLNHPGIPDIYDVFEDENYLYIVEQYIEGESLGELCKHRLLSEKELFNIFIRITSIIEYLHSLAEPIVYLDIKPDNVIVAREEAFLVDFGNAVRLGSETGSRYASLQFCAPEQSCNGKVNKSTDIYSLGKMLIFMTEHSNAGRNVKMRLLRVAKRCCGELFRNRISTADILLKMLNKIRSRETCIPKEPGREGLKGCKAGVLGLGPGAGATHIAVMLAVYLADAGSGSVCLIEESGHKDLESLLKAVSRKTFEPGKPVRLNGVTFFAGDAASQIQFHPEEFDYIIRDLGCDRRKALSKLGECDIGIAVAEAAPWRREQYDFLTRLAGCGELPVKWRILVNPAAEGMLKSIPETGFPCYPFPFEPEPLEPSRKSAAVFERAMK